MSKITITFVFAFIITIALISALRPLANGLGLVDQPGGRKKHQGLVPVVGGIAIFGGVSCSVLVSAGFSSALAAVIGITTLLVMVGFVDDVRGLPALEKFAAQIIATALMITVAGTKVTSLGFLTPASISLSGAWAIAFTIFGAVGLINAINMIDGMDGLAGGVAAIALLLFGLAASLARDSASAQLALATLFSVLGFLIFNIRTHKRGARVFMGDAGSLGLGFVLVWLAVNLSQGPNHTITPIAAVWILAVPLLDAVTVMLHRIIRGISPFSADRSHLHHILRDHGLSVNQTLLVILILSSWFGLIGLGSVYLGVSEQLMLALFLIFSVVYFFATLYAKRKLARERLEMLLMMVSRNQHGRSRKSVLVGQKTRSGEEPAVSMDEESAY